MLLLTASLSVGLGGCATVMNGTSTPYRIDSEPAYAAVDLTGGQKCGTPCLVDLKRKNDLRADITLEGYKPVYVLIQSKLGGSTFGNVILGGGIGAVVDGTNGASNRLYPRPLKVRLAREGTNEEAMLLDKDGKEVKTVQQHNDSVRLDVAKSIGAKLAGLED